MIGLIELVERISPKPCEICKTATRVAGSVYCGACRAADYQKSKDLRHSPSAVEGQAPTDEPTSKSAPRASDWINFLYGEQSEPDEERIEDYDE